MLDRSFHFAVAPVGHHQAPVNLLLGGLVTFANRNGAAGQLKMTEAEIIESVFIMGAGAVSLYAIYVSILFAYLAAAYFVGSDLTRFQALVVSCLFVAAETIAGSTCAASVFAWEKLIAEKASFLNTIPFFTLGTVHIYMAVVLASGVLVALYFMHDVRKKVPKSANASAT